MNFRKNDICQATFVKLGAQVVNVHLFDAVAVSRCWYLASISGRFRARLFIYDGFCTRRERQSRLRFTLNVSRTGTPQPLSSLPRVYQGHRGARTQVGASLRFLARPRNIAREYPGQGHF